jgi:hypothetical protein
VQLAAVVFAGAVSRQFVVQLPQCDRSFDESVSHPSRYVFSTLQSRNGLAQPLTLHSPFAHPGVPWFVLHGRLHPPQWFTLSPVSDTSQPLLNRLPSQFT